MKEFTCSICGAVHPISNIHELGRLSLCPDCFENDTIICSECGDRILEEENSGNSSIPLCEDCYDRYYTTCERCGALIRQRDEYFIDDDGPYCERCYESKCEEQAIRDYYYKPEPIFYGEAKRFFGVELEIDEGGEYNDNAQEILDIANGNGLTHIYCKHDGSLDEGFEIVTHPMTLAYHKEEMPWASVMDKAKRMGYTSHQCGTCGLHVHINRTAFGDSEDVQDIVIARILYFFEKHWEELLKFSRRTQYQLDRWAARYGYKEQPQDIMKHAKEGHKGRYTAVNLTNLNTIEFRMFRGTLKLNTFYATLQLGDYCNGGFPSG